MKQRWGPRIARLLSDNCEHVEVLLEEQSGFPTEPFYYRQFFSWSIYIRYRMEATKDILAIATTSESWYM